MQLLMIFGPDDFDVIARLTIVHLVIFDRSWRCRGARNGYRNISLGIPQATACYCTAEYAGADAIMAAVPKMT
jgi:hypothetical protein